MLATALVALFAIAGAQAVHDDGIFQLDGNAQASADPNGFGGQDWDQICLVAEGSGCTGPSGTAQARSFQDDGASNATIFTGGGSKDDLDIDGWEWKDQSGGLPDKDNLTHAYAARYTAEIDASPRWSRDASLLRRRPLRQQRRRADRVPVPPGRLSGFSPVPAEDRRTRSVPMRNVVGDVLVLSDFTGGGTDPTIRVFMWNPGAPGVIDGTLVPLAGGTRNPGGGAGAHPRMTSARSRTRATDAGAVDIPEQGPARPRSGKGSSTRVASTSPLRPFAPGFRTSASQASSPRLAPRHRWTRREGLRPRPIRTLRGWRQHRSLLDLDRPSASRCTDTAYGDR